MKYNYENSIINKRSNLIDLHRNVVYFAKIEI